MGELVSPRIVAKQEIYQERFDKQKDKIKCILERIEDLEYSLAEKQVELSKIETMTVDEYWTSL